MEEKLKNIFEDKFKVTITDENKDHTLRMLGLSSLDFVTLVVEIEEKLYCDLYSYDIDMSSLRTFNKFLEAINKYN